MSDDLAKLVPHKPPMLMIDRLITHGAERIVAEHTIRDGRPFVDGGTLDTSALIEIVAQSIAVGDAKYARSKGNRVERGYLTGVTGLTLHRNVHVGETLTINADCLRRMDGQGLFDASVTVEDEIIAEGRFKLFVEMKDAPDESH